MHSSDSIVHHHREQRVLAFWSCTVTSIHVSYIGLTLAITTVRNLSRFLLPAPQTNLFICLSVALSEREGRHGYIVPPDYLCIPQTCFDQKHDLYFAAISAGRGEAGLLPCRLLSIDCDPIRLCESQPSSVFPFFADGHRVPGREEVQKSPALESVQVEYNRIDVGSGKLIMRY